MDIVERLRELAKAADEQTDKDHGDFHRMLADTIQQLQGTCNELADKSARQAERIREMEERCADKNAAIADWTQRYAEKCNQLAEVVEYATKLRKGLQDYEDGNYEHARRINKCKHDRYGYEGCEQCIDDHMQTLLALDRKSVV